MKFFPRLELLLFCVYAKLEINFPQINGFFLIFLLLFRQKIKVWKITKNSFKMKYDKPFLLSFFLSKSLNGLKLYILQRDRKEQHTKYPLIFPRRVAKTIYVLPFSLKKKSFCIVLRCLLNTLFPGSQLVVPSEPDKSRECVKNLYLHKFQTLMWGYICIPNVNWNSWTACNHSLQANRIFESNVPTSWAPPENSTSSIKWTVFPGDFRFVWTTPDTHEN